MQSSQQVKPYPESNQNQESHIHMIYHMLQHHFGAAAFALLEDGTLQNSEATSTTSNNQAILYDPRDPGTITLDQAYTRVAEIIKASNDKPHPSLSLAYNQLGISYHRLGTQENNSDLLQTALQYYKNTLTIDLLIASSEQEHFYTVSVTCNYIGMVCCDLNMLDDALQYHKAALRIKTVFSNHLKAKDISIADSYNNLANVHYYLGNIEEAIKCYNDALKVANYNSKEPTPFLAKIYDNLAYLYESIGNIRLAKTYYKIELDISRGLNLTERIHEVKSYLHSLKLLKLKIDYKEEHGAQQDTDEPAEEKVSADCATLADPTLNSSPLPVSQETTLATKSKRVTLQGSPSVQGIFSSSQLKWKIFNLPVANNSSTSDAPSKNNFN